MKNLRYISAVVLSAVVMFASAQEAKKDFSDYQPKSGDLGISINAVPLLKYCGNLFNGTTNNRLTDFGGQPLLNDDVRDLPSLHDDLLSISMKYMVTDKFATRVNVGFWYSYSNDRKYSIDDAALAADPFSQAKVIDSRRVSTLSLSFFAGGEYRIGKGRVQGIFGGGLTYVCLTNRINYSWGNAITEINQNPTSNNEDAVTLPSRSGIVNPRYLSRNLGGDHYVGLTGFVGIEWFVAPKISFGGEVNLSVLGGIYGKKYFLAEGYSTITGKCEQWFEKTSPVSTSFDLFTGNVGANLSVNFYITR